MGTEQSQMNKPSGASGIATGLTLLSLAAVSLAFRTAETPLPEGPEPTPSAPTEPVDTDSSGTLILLIPPSRGTATDAEEAFVPTPLDSFESILPQLSEEGAVTQGVRSPSWLKSLVLTRELPNEDPIIQPKSPQSSRDDLEGGVPFPPEAQQWLQQQPKITPRGTTPPEQSSSSGTIEIVPLAPPGKIIKRAPVSEGVPFPPGTPNSIKNGPIVE